MLCVHSEVLSCLGHLSLAEERSSSSSAPPDRAAGRQSKRAKKLRGREVRRSGGRTGALDDALLARDMAEADAQVSTAKRGRATAATLTAVFTAYFALLKQQPGEADTNAQHYARVIPIVMQGVDKSADDAGAAGEEAL